MSGMRMYYAHDGKNGKRETGNAKRGKGKGFFWQIVAQRLETNRGLTRRKHKHRSTKAQTLP